MCQYFVLPLKNFPEYGVSTNMSYLQKPVTQEQLYYRSYKTYSRNLLSSKSFWFLLLSFSKHHQGFWPLLCLISVTDFEGQPED